MIENTLEGKEFILGMKIKFAEPVKILYDKGNGEITIREILPLKFTDNDTNILAKCELRDGDFRKFKLDKIVAIQVITEH